MALAAEKAHSRRKPGPTFQRLRRRISGSRLLPGMWFFLCSPGANARPLDGATQRGMTQVSQRMVADARRQHGYIGAVMPAPDPDIRRKRLRFRSWHRGTREADLLLGSFADANLAQFDEARLDRYETLLDVPDADLFDWITGRAAPPPQYDTAVIRLLLAFGYRPQAS